MSRAQRDKGARAERELVHLLTAAGIKARRVPLSGAVEGFGGDLLVEDGDGEARWESKVRGDGNGFSLLYRWIEDAAVLAVRADRKPWLVVVRLEDWIREHSPRHADAPPGDARTVPGIEEAGSRDAGPGAAKEVDLDGTRPDKTGQHQTRPDETRQDATGRDWTGRDSTRQDMT